MHKWQYDRMKDVKVNAKEIIEEISKPEKMRVTLYVSSELYREMQSLVGKEISKATEALWQRFIDSALTGGKKK